MKNKSFEIVILLNAYALLLHLLMEFELSVLPVNILQLFIVTALTIVVCIAGRFFLDN